LWLYSTECGSRRVTEKRKFAILFAATILAAGKLIDLDPSKPSMGKGFFVYRVIESAAFVLERIDARWPVTGRLITVRVDQIAASREATDTFLCAKSLTGKEFLL